MPRLIVLVFVFTMLAGCGQSEPQSGPANPPATEPSIVEMVFLAEDGLAIHGWFKESPAGQASLVVGLPMRRSTHESYAPLFEAIEARLAADTMVPRPVPHLLALDLRGHGKSIYRNGDTILVETMPTSDYLAIPYDVALVVDSLVAALGDRIDTANIIVVGASIGANAAIMATQHTDAIDKVVLLSPGTDYRGMEPAESFREFAGETLIVATRGDSYSFNSSQQLMKEKMSGWLLKAYGGSAHGTDLIKIDKTAMQDVLDWMFAKSEATN